MTLRIKNTIIYIAFVTFMSTLLFAVLRVCSQGISNSSLAYISGWLGLMMGSLAWGLLTVSSTPPKPSIGWRRYRFFMWWTGVTVAFNILCASNGIHITFWHCIAPSVIMSLYFVLIGWGVAHLRARRYIDSHKGM